VSEVWEEANVLLEGQRFVDRTSRPLKKGRKECPPFGIWKSQNEAVIFCSRSGSNVVVDALEEERNIDKTDRSTSAKL
jgi:hypothetical protein